MFINQMLMNETHPEQLTEGQMGLIPKDSTEGTYPIQLSTNNLPQYHMDDAVTPVHGSIHELGR